MDREFHTNLVLLCRYLGERKYSEILEEFPDREKYPLYYEASRHEFTINAGEMLFIPAGWFHFVFSEDADKDTGLNAAVNFWYHPENNWKEGTPSCLLPRKTTYDLNIDLQKLCGKEKLRVFHSDLNGMFPSDRVFHKFNPRSIRQEHMTYDEFYETKNPKYYILQSQNSELVNYAPKYNNPLYISSLWINFGNARSLIHYDEYDNWLCQLQGKKRVLLFPYENIDKLYMMNPIPVPISKTILDIIDRLNYYIGKMEGILSPQFCECPVDEISVYKNEIGRYMEHKLNRFLNFDPPSEFQIIETKTGTFNQTQNYPILCFMIIDGHGDLFVAGRETTSIKKGDVICFPNHFTFDFCINGYLKLVLPK